MNKFTFLLALAAIAFSLSAAGQSINNKTANDWPDSRYQVHGDGTVTDTVTDLMWTQCGLGQDHNNNCSGNLIEHNWQQALEAPAAYSLSDYSDWRLPNVKELASLLSYYHKSPSINATIFPNTADASQSGYWSSTPYADYSYGAWTVDFGGGRSKYRTRDSGYSVLLVRAGR